MLDKKSNALIEQIEKLLKDKMTHYVIASLDAEGFFYVYDNAIVAKGMIDRLDDLIDQQLSEEEDYEDA